MTIKPYSPPIDATFRFMEPENSYFTIFIPHHLTLNKDYKAEVSNTRANINLDVGKNQISIQSKTEKAMTNFATNIYIYSDKYYTKVLASYRVEV